MVTYRRGTRGWGLLSAPLPVLLLQGARRTGRYLMWLGLGVSVLLLLGVGLGPHTGRYQTLTVLSGSMGPTFNTGDVVVATPEPLDRLAVGQVIVYTEPIAGHATVSHRVVWLKRDGAGVLIHTRGDANPAEDPWTARLSGPTVWQVRFPVPRLGYLLNWLQHLPLRLFGPYLIGAVGAVWLVVRIWRPTRRPAARTRPGARVQSPAADQPDQRVTSTASTGPPGGSDR